MGSPTIFLSSAAFILWMYGRPPQNGPIYDGGNARRVDGTLYALRLVIAYGDRLFDTDVNAPRGAGFDDRGFLDVLGQDIRDVGLFPIEHFRVAFVIILAIIPNDVFFVPARGIAKGRKLGGAAGLCYVIVCAATAQSIVSGCSERYSATSFTCIWAKPMIEARIMVTFPFKANQIRHFLVLIAFIVHYFPCKIKRVLYLFEHTK